MNNLTDIIKYFTSIALKVIPLLAVIAFLVFVLGVARFIKASGEGKDIKDAKKILIWGVIGLFVLTSIWGIVSFIRGELGFSTNVGIPQIRIGR